MMGIQKHSLQGVGKVLDANLTFGYTILNVWFKSEVSRVSVRLADVAREAKVSLGAVSAVVNGSRSNTVVSSETQRRIIKIARRMGYIPNSAARAVRSRRFHRVAAAVIQYGPPGASYTPYNGYIDSAVNELAERGYSLVLEPLHLDVHDDQFFEPPRLFSELAVDGVLGLPASGLVPAPVDEQLRNLAAPVIWMNRNPEEAVDNVVCDEAAGARQLVRHLLNLGHRRIGYLGFKTPHYSAAQRYETVRAELLAGGMDVSGLAAADPLEALLETTERLFGRPATPTGLICFNRIAYQTAIHVLARRGLKIPGEVSVCYFASPWETVMTRFSATVLEVPEEAIAVTATRMLLDRIEEKPIGEVPKPAGTLHVGLTTGAAR